MAYIDTYIPARVPRQKVCMYVSLKSKGFLTNIHTSRFEACARYVCMSICMFLKVSLLTYIPHVTRPMLGMYVCLYVCFAN